jgi:hypothetical protein
LPYGAGKACDGSGFAVALSEQGTAHAAFWRSGALPRKSLAMTTDRLNLTECNNITFYFGVNRG